MKKFLISNVRDLRSWVESVIDTDSAGAARAAQAVWERPDFPHPVNVTDITAYLDGIDAEFLQAAAEPEPP